MSININSTIRSLLSQLKAEESSLNQSKSSVEDFAETLAGMLGREGKPGGDAVSAAALASMIRLEMMRGILSSDDPDSKEPVTFAPSKIRISQPTASLVSQKYDLQSQESITDRKANEYQIAKPLDEIIDNAAGINKVEPALIRAVIKAESSFDQQAVSRVGAEGLMQLMPETARDLGVQDSFDPEQNVAGGTRYLKQLLDKYDGNLDTALAAYNWGPGNVDRKGTSSLPKETTEYLARVKKYYDEYKA